MDEEMIIGSRVARVPNWNYQNVDDGEGRVGTITDVKDGHVTVTWDSGNRTNCRVDNDGRCELIIIDIGVKLENYKCSGCDKDGIDGIRFNCQQCQNYDLCTICYGNGKHNLKHSFIRYLDTNSEGVLVASREESTKLALTGMFAGAKVVPGPDWQYDGDGTEDKIGRVVNVKKVKNKNGYSVEVIWDKEQESFRYGLGLDGKVDLKTEIAANGGYYYRDHMPRLELPQRIQVTSQKVVGKTLTRNSASISAHRDENGILLLFNQEHFNNAENDRPGSREDVIRICNTFTKFNLKPEVFNDLTAAQIKETVYRLQTRNLRKIRCFVAIILSHGYTNGVILAKDTHFNLDTDFIHKITSYKELMGIPKIFIIGACKGPKKVHEDNVVGKGKSNEPDNNAALPKKRDILKCFSTYEEYVSIRYTQTGTPFIQKFCDVLDSHGRTLSVIDIMEEVTKDLSENKVHPQVPSLLSTMSFRFSFGDLLN